MSEISKTKIDQLGERLKHGNITGDDLRMLDDYRRSFSEAYESVVKAIVQELKLEPTGRPAKSTTSIAEKLKRETIRLTQVQDIAGCRLIVTHMLEQELVIQRLNELFDDVTMVDRRERPSHGYRAVHMIVRIAGKLVEIQIRTGLQHLWAEQSEKMSDIVDPAIKYGGGDELLRQVITKTSDVIANEESFELELDRDQKAWSARLEESSLNPELEEKILGALANMRERQERIAAIRQRLAVLMQATIDKLLAVKRPRDVIPN